jgi:serine/threonine-protein kinase
LLAQLALLQDDTADISQATTVPLRKSQRLRGPGAQTVPEPREFAATIAGRYTLSRLLGRGGMGAVWLARDERLRRPVAVKLLRVQMLGSEGMMARFRREATAVARLRSTHIVEVYDYGVDGESPYIVMELLEGEDLDARLVQHGRMPLDRVASIVSQTAKALTEAHVAGIVHRDLKPANIFLCRRRDGEIVKIIDFGVAKAVERETIDEPTGAGMVLGTPAFMSPEQLTTAAGVDHRADLWSLAVIVYFAFTGRLPFVGNTGETVAAILRQGPTPPSEIVDDCPAALDDFFRVALAKDPDARYPNALTMAGALEDIARSSAPAVTESVALPNAAPPRSRRLRHVLYALAALAALASAIAFTLPAQSPPAAAIGVPSAAFPVATASPSAPPQASTQASGSAPSTTPAPASATVQPRPARKRPEGDSLFRGPW